MPNTSFSLIIYQDSPLMFPSTWQAESKTELGIWHNMYNFIQTVFAIHLEVKEPDFQLLVFNSLH